MAVARPVLAHTIIVVQVHIMIVPALTTTAPAVPALTTIAPAVPVHTTIAPAHTTIPIAQATAAVHKALT